MDLFFLYDEDFENYKSNVCHFLVENGHLMFIKIVTESNIINLLWASNMHKEALYMLAMLDYLCKKEDLPQIAEYSELRQKKLESPIFPRSVAIAYLITKDEKYIDEAIRNALPDFLRHNIIEGDVENVW